MASKYFVGVRAHLNDHHSVHKEGCPFLPDERKRIYLGKFVSGCEAVSESRQYFSRTKCCLFCSKETIQDEEILTISNLVDSKSMPVVMGLMQEMVSCLN